MEPQTTTTATASLQMERRSRLAYATDTLMHKLRRYMRAYPLMQGETMPEHEMVWVTDVERGHPVQAILDAIKANPSLWREALPEDVVLVQRSALVKCGLSSDVVDALASMGGALTEDRAARFAHEQREKDGLF